MNTYCLSCKKDTRNIDPKVIKTKNNRKMMLSRCSICNNKSLHLFHKDLVYLVYNKIRDRMKNALWNAFNR